MSTKPTHQKSPDHLYAWLLMDPQHPQFIGEIIRQTNGDVGLQYAPTWLATGFALSDDMPLGTQTFTPVHRNGRLPGAPGALDDARPDRWGEKVIRYLYKPGASVYDNLYFAGDERFGAIGVCPSNSAYTPSLQRTLPRLEDAADLNAAVQIIESGEGELQAQQRALIGEVAAWAAPSPRPPSRLMAKSGC
jgi:serine/threonine-protein kinase HipA